MITIYDIAKRTGFSPATVSKVLNNYCGVNEQTCKIVLSATREMGYTPNTAARSLKTKKTWLVGVPFSVEVPMGIMHTHFGAIFASAQLRLAEAGYDMVFISNTRNNVSGRRMSYIDHCRSRGVEGAIIAASAPFTDSIRCVLESSVKTVSVETPYKDKYAVLSNNDKGMLQGLSYLRSLGHRHIGFISGPQNSTAGEERNRAFRRFMRSEGLPEAGKWIVETDSYSVREGYEAARNLMERQEKPTAIFAGYGEAVIGAVNYLDERGFLMPEQVSLIGFDNTEVSMARGITTISQNCENIGRLAADLLIRQIEGKDIPYPFEIRLETVLIKRSTCGSVQKK